MRVLLFTGKGGVGKTTVAAATALRTADRGLKTLVLSTDPAHSLGDALGTALGPDPVEVAPGLAAMQVDAQLRFEQRWASVKTYLAGLFAAGGLDPVRAEELTVLPGADEVLALLELRDQAASGRWDVVVVDCAPTAETLRLLALPEALSWYMERAFPTHRRVLRGLRLTRLGGAGLPGEPVLDAVTALHGELADVHGLLASDLTSVRLVLTPEAVVVAESRRTLTSLALHGYRVDAAVVNRVVPAHGRDPWRLGWARAQAEQVRSVRESFEPVPVRLAGYRAVEPVGPDALRELGEELYGSDDPAEVAPLPELVAVSRAAEDEYLLEVALPLAAKADVDLARSGDELVLTVAGRRRLLTLPSVLRRCRVVGATVLSPGVAEARLRVRFEPDPALWRTP